MVTRFKKKSPQFQQSEWVGNRLHLFIEVVLCNEQPYAIAITGHKINHYPNGDEYVFFIVQYLMRFLKIDHQLGNMKVTRDYKWAWNCNFVCCHVMSDTETVSSSSSPWSASPSWWSPPRFCWWSPWCPGRWWSWSLENWTCSGLWTGMTDQS